MATLIDSANDPVDDRYKAVTREIGDLKVLLKDLNRTMSHASGETKKELEKELGSERKRTKARLEALQAEAKKLYEQRRQRGRQRQMFYRHSLYAAASETISALLQERYGDEWPEEATAGPRDLCYALNRAAYEDAPIHAQVLAAQQQAEKVQAQLNTAQAELATLRQQVATLRRQAHEATAPRPNAARDVLRRIWQERYPEVDAFRKARGVAWRIHLTEDDAHAIAEALGEVYAPR